MRCNLISPSFLTDQHLIAERNELRFIPPLLERKYVAKGLDLIKDIPEKFCLGKGHMNFWMDKHKYLKIRFNLLTFEMQQRGFNTNTSTTYGVELAKNLGLYKDWSPTEEDITIIKERIRYKIMLKPEWYRYYSKPITLDWVNDIYDVTK